MLSLVTWLWYVNPYLQYVFTVVMFVTSRKRVSVTILLYCVISNYENIAGNEVRLVFVCNNAVIAISRMLCPRIY